jgi:hypothetical protein
MGYQMKNSVEGLISGNSPIVKKDLGPNVHGETLNDGTIVINKRLSPVQQKIAIKHEKVHRKQIQEGRLSYDENYVYWNDEKYPRKGMKEGAKNLPWEAEAYKQQNKK